MFDTFSINIRKRMLACNDATTHFSQNLFQQFKTEYYAITTTKHVTQNNHEKCVELFTALQTFQLNPINWSLVVHELRWKSYKFLNWTDWQRHSDVHSICTDTWKLFRHNLHIQVWSCCFERKKNIFIQQFSFFSLCQMEHVAVFTRTANTNQKNPSPMRKSNLLVIFWCLYFFYCGQIYKSHKQNTIQSEQTP